MIRRLQNQKKIRKKSSWEKRRVRTRGMETNEPIIASFELLDTLSEFINHVLLVEHQHHQDAHFPPADILVFQTRISFLLQTFLIHSPISSWIQKFPQTIIYLDLFWKRRKRDDDDDSQTSIWDIFMWKKVMKNIRSLLLNGSCFGRMRRGSQENCMKRVIIWSQRLAINFIQ